MSTSTSGENQQASAYFNDRTLYGVRTGVGHYLGLIQAHWPEQPAVQLKPMSRSFGPGSQHTTAAQYTDLTAQLLPIEQTSLNQLSPPSVGVTGDMTKRILRSGFGLVHSRALRSLAKRSDFGLFFEPNHLPASIAGTCVATIHDLSVLEHPEYHPAHRVEWWNRSVERAMDSTDHFICVSHATASAMTRVIGCPRDRLSVIPLAPRWTRPLTWEPKQLREQLGLPDRYWLHVGTIEPRKNIIRLLDAYAAMSASERERTKLVICGRVGWGSKEHWDQLINHPVADQVIVTGYAQDIQVAAMMVGSIGVLCPSHYEGFGLPIIEAMALQVPCAISKAESLVEISNGFAKTIDASDTDGWTHAMRAMVEPPDTQHLQAAAAHAQSYSWTKAAQSHHDLFNSMIKG
ncbi:MAG: glycosyltransferase family 4 protein [Phycisphaerales bacterium]